MKKLILFLAIFFLSPFPLLAQVYIVELMPNTEGEPNTEYIVLQNTGCSTLDISNYQIADKKKQYSFAAGSTLASYETYKIVGSISKIELNNTDEELYLRDAAGALLHTYTYSRSTKNLAITVPGISLDTCMNDDEEGTDTIEDIGTDATEEDESISGSEEEGVDGENGTGAGVELGEEDAGTENTEESQEDNSSEESDDVEMQDDDSPTEKDEDVSNGGILELDDEGLTESSEEIDEDIQTSHLLGKSGSLEPQILLYSDSDGDNRIDMFEVFYDVYITGSIDLNRIFLYSNTGGLYDIRANTATGYIIDAEIEDNILRLFIEPSHFEKSVLIHNATTQSHIRLKSSGGFGITNLTGAVVDDFLLTSSFDAYREVYEKGVYQSIGMEDASEEDEIGSGATTVTFPEIVPTIQNYTNTTLSGNTLICRETPCRLNLNFESIFNTMYPSNSYTCRVTYNGITEDKCNPSQWNPTAAGGVDVRVTHKATGQYQTQYFPIEWNIITNPVTTIPNVYDRSAPVPRITLNGALSKKQILGDDNHIYCYTNTCSLNFDGSDTYDPDGSSMTYTWSLSGKVFATKKNPTIQEFGIGEHTIEFTVIDSSGKSSQENYRVSVLGEIAIVPDTEIAIASDISSKKPKKKQTMNFFSPPEVIVEKSSSGFSKMSNGYRCVSVSTSCSVNFALTGTIEGIYYRFSYAHELIPTWSINPRSKSFQTGKYTLMLSAHYEKDGESIWQELIPIEIIRVKKPKAIKAVSSKDNSRSVEKLSDTIDIIPTAYADNADSDVTDSGLVLSLLFFSVVLNGFFLMRRKINNV